MMTKMLPTASKAYITQTRQLFHCHIKIKIPIEGGEALLEDCFALLEQLDRRYNSHQPGSFFSRINQQAGYWVEVDDACIALLQQLQLISTLTAGSYDISCMPLIRLWGFYQQNTANLRIPSVEDLTTTLQKVGYQQLEIKANFVRIAAGQELITGSFIKAFAVDQVIAFLKEKGITDAIINAGGSTIMGINDETHPQWKVHIPSAFVPEQRERTIAIANACFSLSGSAHNQLVIDGQTYGHILDSRTGYPVSTAQVGVITPTAFLGDALSTALFTVQEGEVASVIAQLRRHFDFDYYRIEHNKNK